MIDEGPETPEKRDLHQDPTETSSHSWVNEDLDNNPLTTRGKFDTRDNESRYTTGSFTSHVFINNSKRILSFRIEVPKRKSSILYPGP